MVLQVPPVQHQEDLAEPDHLFHPDSCPDHSHLMSGLLQLPSRKPTNLHHSAPTTGPERGCSACVQPPEVLPCPTPLLRSLHWLPVVARIRFKVHPGLHCSQKSGPSYLQDLIQHYAPARPLRSAAAGRLALPFLCVNGSRSSRLQSFSTLAPQWWNELPTLLCSAQTLSVFCRGLKTHFFRLHLD
ncbi:hypothetical protein SKAU_G00212450 [Synaphobranchus kaupii]|uniref:Uncharacterized protein n=1 Tax=Synaphobranchus kaupii TaxID=118154 RepID=A0A9Q1F970_SYNKA|nr:hypothetical protein SKAU_G00212450 [Synaphobranchus kaupii]